MGPIVVIGLGGVGSEIVSLLEERANLWEDSQKNVRLIIMDTDVGALRERLRAGFGGTCIQISDNMTVEQYLHYDKNAGNWYPQCTILNQKTLTEGAGQVRAISRLALNMCLEKGGLRELYRVIDELHLLRAENAGQPTRLIIVSSLAGGTGSGLFLPVAMHLRAYLKRTYRNSEPIIKGFFVMPSVFDYVAGSDAERISLHSNGYAAIKELNAFMLMRDKVINDLQYPTLKIELCGRQTPKEIYKTAPYDLCFLFEKQNQDDKHLISFDESKRNIAECISMQAINPMLDQNNALEDNLFKVVTVGGTRYERFAGMGISRLEYPYERLSRYLSIVLARQVVNEHWAAADLKYIEQQRQTEDEGELFDLRFDDWYIRFAEEQEGFWKEEIRKVCEEKWVSRYCDAVSELCKEYENLLDEAMAELNTHLGYLRTEENRSLDYIKNIENLHEHQKMKFARRTREGKQHIRQKLKEDEQKNSAPKEYQLVYWIKQGGLKAEGCTPIQARYFLISLQKELDTQINNLESNTQTLEEQIKDVFPKNIEKLKIQIIKSGNSRRFPKLFSKIYPAIEPKKDGETHTQTKEIAVKTVWDSFIDTLVNGQKQEKRCTYQKLQIEIYKEIRAWVHTISEKYTHLIEECNTLVKEKVNQQRRDLQHEFAHPEGKNIRLVCITEKCLNEMEKIVCQQARNEREGNQFSSYLCELAMGQAKEKYFDSDILESFWLERYQKNIGCQRRLNINILRALENEARWESGLSKENPNYEKMVSNYVSNVFDIARNIYARAFLRIPDISKRHMLEMNFYPEELENETGMLKQLVSQEFKRRIGVQSIKHDPSDSQGKYRIDFYRAVFGVSACEISPFLREEADSPYLPGESFTAYKSIVGFLDEEKNQQNFLTPHLDKNWHSVFELPELTASSDENIIKKILILALENYSANPPSQDQKQNQETCQENDQEKGRETEKYSLAHMAKNPAWVIQQESSCKLRICSTELTSESFLYVWQDLLTLREKDADKIMLSAVNDYYYIQKALKSRGEVNQADVLNETKSFLLNVLEELKKLLEATNSLPKNNIIVLERRLNNMTRTLENEINSKK